MKFSSLVNRVAGDGADAWRTHYAAVAARDRGENVIILSVGDPDLPAPPSVVDKAIANLRAGDSRYTPARGRRSLRQAIAAVHAERTGQRVDTDQVIVLSGAQNALFVAALCLAGPGDEVLALDPMYPTYPATIEAGGARMVRVRLAADRGFRLDLDALTAAITPRTRALFYASPGNPSGVILSADELDVIGEIARRHDLWIVADEVYAGLAPAGRVPSLAARMPERVISINSLSKTHSIPGWRAGWMIGPTELTEHAENLMICMLYGLPGFIQDAAVTALTTARHAEQGVREFCLARAALMARELRAIPGIGVRMPEAGMFMLVDVRGTGLTAAQFATELYRRHGVSVMDGAAFGEETRGFVRLCFATDEAAINEACRRIRHFCGIDLKLA